MKTESNKILENIGAFLSVQKNALANTAICNTSDVLDIIHTVRESLERIARIETPAASRAKFNLWSYVDKNEYRPAMECIYCDNGYKIASDSHILVAVKESYSPEDENTMTNKNGIKYYEKSVYQNTPGIEPGQLLHFPKWREIIPSKNNLEISVNLAAFQEIKNDWKQYKKAYKLNATEEEKTGVVKIGPAYFTIDKFDKMAAFMTAYGTNVLKLAQDQPARRAAMARNENGDLCLIMPSFIDESAKYNGYTI